MTYRVTYRMRGERKPFTRLVAALDRQHAMRLFVRYMLDCGAEPDQFQIVRCSLLLHFPQKTEC